MYKVKDISDSVKDVHIKNRTVSGYFSVFGIVDSDGDVITKGAFSKSIQENGPNSERARIMHLYQHNPSQPIGKIIELAEDDHGLFFVSEISKSSLGRDVLQMYDEGILKEHSIGFNILQSDTSGDAQMINEVKLWEGSTVTWGANMHALAGDKKSLFKDMSSAKEQIQKWEKVLRKGDLTDETCNLLMIQLAQFKELLSAEQSRESEEEQVLKQILDFKNQI